MGLRFERDVDTNYGIFVTQEIQNYLFRAQRKFGKNTKEELDSMITGQSIIIILVTLIAIGFVYASWSESACLSGTLILFYGLILWIIVDSITTVSSEINCRNTQDILHKKYLETCEYYKTVVSCPVCATKVKFEDSESLPFQGKCKSCDYIFTVIVDNKRERFYTYGPRGGQHSNAIEYDGIKAIKPRAQRVQYIDKTVNIDESVKIDIKDSIIYKSTVVGRIEKNK